jgi:AraC-like DNA-binding protein
MMKENQKSLLQRYLSNTQWNLNIAAFTKVSSNWKSSGEIPSYNRLYFIREGKGSVSIGDKTFHPRPGQLFILPAGSVISYSTISDDTFSKFWCHFTAMFGDLNLFQILEIPYFIDVADESYLEAQFKQLITYYHSDEVSAVLRMKAVLLDIICYYIDRAGIEKVQLGASSAIDKLGEVLKHIDSHIAEDITVEELARLVHFHPNYFIRFFKTMLGTSPIHYINKIRIEKAKQQLITTDQSITEIATTIGLQMYYFSRLFKSHTGFSPSEFRHSMTK